MSYPKYRIVDTWRPTSMEPPQTMYKAQVRLGFWSRWQNLDMSGLILMPGYESSGPFGLAAQACTRHFCHINHIDYQNYMKGLAGLNVDQTLHPPADLDDDRWVQSRFKPIS